MGGDSGRSGPFHSEDLEGLYGTFPGLKLVYPSFVEDYFLALLSSIYDDNPVLFFENKYLQRRLKGNIDFDGNVPELVPGRVIKQGESVTILAYGAMLHEALAAAQKAEKKGGISVEIIDPLLLKPFNWDTLSESLAKTHRLLVVHESWASCSMGSWIIAGAMERSFFDLDAPPMLYAAPDTPVPFAPELEASYRPKSDRIVEKIEQLLSY